MVTDVIHEPTGGPLDLSGLPESVAHRIRQLVQALREEYAGKGATALSSPHGQKPLIGRLAHLGLKTPTLEEFEEARREAWADFPREFPDPAK